MLSQTKDLPEEEGRSRFLTHTGEGTLELTSGEIQSHVQRLEAIEKPTLPLEEELEFLHQLMEFDLGRFLLKNGGLNGYWIEYIILHAPQKVLANPLERWIIHEAPSVRATRERFCIFQDQLQACLSPGKSMASIPCGLMTDLLSLDYRDISGIKLVGIDLDPESLKLAEAKAKQLDNSNISTSFIQKDTLDLEITSEFDVITSNGLTIYQSEDAGVLQLYKNFYRALLPGGVLITSFLTPPPTLSPESTWKNYDKAAALRQKALFGDVLNVKWQAFRTEPQTLDLLSQAGFVNFKVRYDSQGMFPMVVAGKP